MYAIEQFQRKINVPVSQVLEVGPELIVVLDYYKAKKLHVWETLFRIRADGSVAWKLSAPGSTDIFTNVAWRDGKLIAWTWECFMITIDEASGTILESVFTK